MPEQPLTDDDLRAFLAADDARTPGECQSRHGTRDMAPSVHNERYGLAATCFDDADADYIAACTRLARRMAEELLARRGAG